jgi:S-adenosylmethionine decarboxylase
MPPASIRQLTVDVYECAGDLDDVDAIKRSVRDGCRRVGATVGRLVSYGFQPHGTTVVAILLESHVIVSTWPEHRFACVEAFLCNETMDPRALIDSVLSVLRPAREVTHVIEHDVAPAPLARQAPRGRARFGPARCRP